MKKFFMAAWLWGVISLQSMAQSVLFHTGDASGFPYRIPAIATTAGGELVALADRRPCGRDIGYGRVDILGRTSSDNGTTWTEPFDVLVGTGQGPDTGFGDACLVADREREELLLVCVAGDVPYPRSTIEHSQRMVSIRAYRDAPSGTWRWDTLTDHTASVYRHLFDRRVNGLFMSSGRICQSRRVKVGDYYRLYAALCTHQGNFVLYSDDFGRSWQVLGSATESCVPKGDEAKCEELPDGSVLISSRKSGGRYFNLFRYDDVQRAQGRWDTPVDSREAPGGICNEGTPCNGELLMVTHRGQAYALQSVPAGPKRTHVTIYWKALSHPSDYQTPLSFASHWQGGYQVSQTTSAYSTMTLLPDGRVGFYWEEDERSGGYDLVFRAIPLDDILR